MVGLVRGLHDNQIFPWQHLQVWPNWTPCSDSQELTTTTTTTPYIARGKIYSKQDTRGKNISCKSDREMACTLPVLSAENKQCNIFYKFLHHYHPQGSRVKTVQNNDKNSSKYLGKYFYSLYNMNMKIAISRCMKCRQISPEDSHRN